MEKADVKKLWALLAELYPRQKQTETKERLGAWAMALEPFDYAAIREAALAHARKCDYYPSISEITANLPKPDKNAWMDEYIKDTPSPGELWAEYIEEKGLDNGEGRFSVSRYAREHGLTWEQAAVEAHDRGLID